ncbi:MAG: hypothetical protein K0R14_1226 [Burkholderiales bacterium]|jgi:AsmA protein|nr:hypothetical protein [Burkholderiales bacterium]
MNIRRITKISLISLSAVFGLIIAGAVALVTFVNPNSFKPLIIKAVNESTQRKLAIDGNISWKLWPNIGLQIEKLSLSNPEGYTPVKMLDVNSATVSVELMPLLARNVVIDSIIVDGLNIGLIKKADSNNWTFKSAANPDSGSTSAAHANKPMQLELSKFILTNTTFSYNDMTTNKQYSIKDFAFSLEKEFGGQISVDPDSQKITLNKVKIDFDNILNGKFSFVANNFDKLAYQGDVNINKLSVPALANKLNQPIAILKGSNLFNQVAFSVAFKGDLNSIVLNGFNFNLSDMFKGVVNVQVNNFANPAYNGDIKLDEFSANSVLDSMNIAIAARKGKPLLDRVAFNTKFAGNNNSINLQQLNFNFPGTLQGVTNVKVQNFSAPTYSGDIKLNEFSANALLDKLNVAVAARKDNQLLNKVALNTNFTGNTDSINLQQLKFNFPGTLQGVTNVKLQNFSAPAYSGDIKLNEFSANSVLDKMNIAVASRKGNQLLNKVALSSAFAGNSNNVDLQQLNFNFPGILQGITNVKIQNFSKPSYTGNIDLPTFSLNLLMAKLAMAPIDIPNKQLLDKVSLKTNFQATSNSINLSNLLSTISGSTVSGGVNVTSIKPLSLSENIRINKLEVSDITDVNGYKVPLTGIAASGSFSNSGADFKNMAGVSANQNITVDNVTVLGLDLNNLFTQFDNALTSTGKVVAVVNLQTISHTTRAIQAVQNMRDIAARAKAKGNKNYNEKTNFGMLQSSVTMRNGVANPSSFKVSGGPTVLADGKGSVNMVDKSLNYNISAQIVTPMKNQLLNKLIFPYQVHGKFNNIEGGVDWISIQTQMVKYLVTEAVSQAKALATDQVSKQIDTLTKDSNPIIKQNTDVIKKGAADVINSIFK